MKRDCETDSFQQLERDPGGSARRTAWPDAPLSGGASCACDGAMSLEEAIAAEARADRIARKRARSRRILPPLPPALETDDTPENAPDAIVPFPRRIRALLAMPNAGPKQERDRNSDTGPNRSRLSRIWRVILGPMERDRTS